MNIALVKPCWQYPISGADHTYNRCWPPLELLNCAALLEADGHRVEIVDAQALGLPPAEVTRRVARADMVAVTSSALDRWQCPTLELTPLFAATKELRECTERLVLLGFHGTVEPEAMLKETGVDIVVRGEPEETVRELASKKPLDSINGISFSLGNEFVSTADREPLDMTKLPVPAMHLVDPRWYQYEVLGSRFMVLEGVRGCPYACTFCSRVIQGRKLRRKTVEQLGREVETAVNEHGVRSIYFIDLEFTASRELAEGISQYILDHGIRVRWCCQTRTDQIDEPLLRLMKKAGCRLVHFGMETGSERIAKLTRKNVSVASQLDGVALAKRVGMEVLCFFLLGHPGETDEEMHETIRLAKKLNPTYAAFHRVSPYHGTPLYDQYASETGEMFPAFAGSNERRDQVDELVRHAIWSYYVRPGYILSRLRRATPVSLWRQLRLFMGFFR